MLRESGYPIPPEDVLPLRETNVASAARTEGAGLGRWLAGILVLFMVSGASIAAGDALAGEKERGTLETLLTTSAGRLEIVGAKLLLVLTVGLVIAACSVGGALGWILLGVGGVSGQVAVAFTPAALVLILVLLAPVAALVSALLLLVSGHARTYREAQLWYLPVTLGLFVPTLSPLLPAVSLRSAIAFVPISGVSVGIRDALLGRFDLLFLAIAWLSTAAAALFVLRRVVKTLSPELLMMSGAEGGSESGEMQFPGRVRFERQVGRVFLGLWAVLLVLSLGAPWSDVRITLFVNLVLLFGGTTLVCLRHWRLDMREALSLRSVSAPVLIGVVVGAPAASIVIIGIFRLVSIILPVPPEALELTARSLLPEEVPLWQLLPLLTILPALFEELAFRGVLLHGMRRRMGPFALIALNGLIFGLFHVSLYRIVPTGVLGAICAALVLVTGSILPAMLWHGLYNASAIGLALAGVSPWDLGAVEYASASALLAVSAWIVWRGRRLGGQESAR
jgi:sodium transport system permease protein